MRFTRYGIKLYCFFLLVALIPLCITGVAFYKYAYDKTKEDVLSKQQLAVHSLNRELQHSIIPEKSQDYGF